MAGSINKVILVGRLGKDPESRTMQNGDLVVNFSVATSETWKDKNTGERREKTEWHNVVIFNDALAKVAQQYCTKGSLVGIEGQMQTRKWTHKDGGDRYTTEVVIPRFRGELTLLSSKGENGGGGGAERSSGGSGSSAKPAERRPADLNDDIPF